MSDLFHDAVPDEFIARVFAVMGLADRHTFQVLTKRPGRMASLFRSVLFRATWSRLRHAVTDAVAGKDTRRQIGARAEWPLKNVWLGTSVENQRWAEVRIPKLLETPAAVRFLSCEPLLGPLDLTDYLTAKGAAAAQNSHTGLNDGIGWVIAGGESGPGWRPMDPQWARDIRDQCKAADVAFFYKQGAGPRPEMDRTLDGRTWEELPVTAGG